MLPPIQSIDINVRTFQGAPCFRYVVSFTRWTGYDKDAQRMTDFVTATYFDPTPASIARCRHAQEQLADMFRQWSEAARIEVSRLTAHQEA